MGWFVDANLSAGFGWRPSRFASDLLGLGTGWARPSDRALRHQYTEEVFYRFHLTENLALTPDVQLVCNPALNPSEDFVWALGFRMRVAF